MKKAGRQAKLVKSEEPEINRYVRKTAPTAGATRLSQWRRRTRQSNEYCRSVMHKGKHYISSDNTEALIDWNTHVRRRRREVRFPHSLDGVDARRSSAKQYHSELLRGHLSMSGRRSSRAIPNGRVKTAHGDRRREEHFSEMSRTVTKPTKLDEPADKCLENAEAEVTSYGHWGGENELLGGESGLLAGDNCNRVTETFHQTLRRNMIRHIVQNKIISKTDLEEFCLMVEMKERRGGASASVVRAVIASIRKQLGL